MNLSINNRLAAIKDKIADSAIKSGRTFEDITFIAVTKTVDVKTIKLALNAGIRDIGENKAQEIMEKYQYIGNDIKLHFLGHLQTNKVKYLIDKVDLIHSLDRMGLARELNRRYGAVGKIANVLVQVNVAKEETKHGIYVEDLYDFVMNLESYKNIRIQGLMTIAPYENNKNTLRSYFTKMYDLYNELKSQGHAHIEMKYLSMGMSNDYEIAIEEGSNMVRIGRAIFGER